MPSSTGAGDAAASSAPSPCPGCPRLGRAGPSLHRSPLQMGLAGPLSQEGLWQHLSREPGGLCGRWGRKPPSSQDRTPHRTVPAGGAAEAPNGSAAKSSFSERTRNPRRVQEGDKHVDLCSAPPQGACRASRAEAAANGNWLGSETPGGTGCLSRDPLAEAAGGDEGGSCRHQPRAQDCWETITMGGRAAAADAPRRPSAAGGASEGDFAGGWRSSGSREEREPAVPESTPPPRAPCDEKRDRCHRHHRRRGLGGGRTRRPS